MDERFTIEGDPEDVLRSMLGTDPDGTCPHCGHSMRLHRVTRHGRREGVTCQIEDCDCHVERPRS